MCIALYLRLFSYCLLLAGKRANNRETAFPGFRESTRHRSERNNRMKNSINPRREAGGEWVCDFDSVAKQRFYETDRLH